LTGNSTISPLTSGLILTYTTGWMRPLAMTVSILFFAFTVATSFAEETNTLPNVVTVDRVTYENVRWGTVTPAAVSILHRTGAATLPLEKLSPELQKRFGYDPQKAADYGAAERRAEAARQEARRKQWAAEAAGRQRQAQQDAENAVARVREIKAVVTPLRREKIRRRYEELGVEFPLTKDRLERERKIGQELYDDFAVELRLGDIRAALARSNESYARKWVGADFGVTKDCVEKIVRKSDKR
jgi:hypothetical protein